MSLVSGAQPAFASTSADCGATSTLAGGELDADLLQACLRDQVDASLGLDEPAAEEPVEATEASYEPVETAEVFAEPVYAIDAVYVVAEEAAPVEEWDVWAALRDCESGGDYGINTGNGYYGAYQFSLSTWQGLGYGGYPHEASPGTQDQAAMELQSLYGWGQWPGCSWYLGLV